MAEALPLVVDVLVRLSLNYEIVTNRLKRAQKAASTKAGSLRREIDRQQRRVAARPGDKRRVSWERRKKNAVAQLKEVGVDEQLEDALALHPFPDVVARIGRWTGCKKETLRAAAAKEFSGYPKLVAKLRPLDGSPQVGRLYRQLIEQHPTLAKKVGIKPEQLAEQDETGKHKRPGRRKADYATVQREAKKAGDWKRAKEAGELKKDFVKRYEGLTVKKLDNLLDRVAKRKTRSDN